MNKEQSDRRLDLGKRGEIKAVRYLRRRRYHIVRRNYSYRGGEIDIIARRGDYLVFVEVKTRSSRQFGRPIEAIDQKKIGKIVRTAAHFCQRFDLADFPQRFDVIEVERVKPFFFWSTWKLTHHPQVFDW